VSQNEHADRRFRRFHGDEFVASDKPVDIEMHMDGAARSPFLALGLVLKVTVIDPDGNPVEGADLLGGDPDATVDHWDKTDARGQAAVIIGVNGADVVVVYKGQVITKRIDPLRRTGMRREGAPHGEAGGGPAQHHAATAVRLLGGPRRESRRSPHGAVAHIWRPACAEL
jgi:hypothetical protein